MVLNAPNRQTIRSMAIACLLLSGLFAFFAFELHQLISFENLATERQRLGDWVTDNPILAPLVMMGIYALAVLFSLPIAVVLTPGIGFLLGTAQGALVVLFGATIGASALFMLARSAFGERWRGKVQSTLAKLDNGFEDNAFQYLLILRLMPVIPFFVLNILPAFAGVSLRTYVAATFIGIIPGTIVYSSIGAGLDKIFARGETPSLAVFTDSAVILPLVCLAVLATLPLAYKKWRQHQDRVAARTIASHT